MILIRAAAERGAAAERDAAAIAHVHIESWRTTYAGIVPEAYLASLNERERDLLWREWLTRDVPVFVAESDGEDGEIVGFVAGGAIRDVIEGYDAELFTIYLLQHAQGGGIGTSLLQTLAATLHTKGFKSMVAWVLESNASSGFYTRTGALPIASKEIEIGGVLLPVRAYGWPTLATLASPR